MQLNSVNWGIIGCGDVTEVKSGPPLYKIEHSRLVAVMRRDGAKAADYAHRHGVAKWYDDPQALIHDEQVNAIYVATPPNTHAAYAIDAMRAGKPVYVEKPMARNFAECEEMIAVSQQTGIPLFVAYYRRALPSFLKVKSLVESGAIGLPLTVRIQLFKEALEKDQEPGQQHWHVHPTVSGGGHFFDLACHQLDFLDFVFGPVTEAKGNCRNLGGYYEPEDTLSASLVFESGVIGSGLWCFVADAGQKQDLIEITGTAGCIRLTCFDHLNVELTNASGVNTFEFDRPQHIGGQLIQQVVNELRGVGTCVSTMYSGARASWVMDRVVGGKG